MRSPQLACQPADVPLTLRFASHEPDDLAPSGWVVTSLELAGVADACDGGRYTVMTRPADKPWRVLAEGTLRPVAGRYTVPLGRVDAGHTGHIAVSIMRGGTPA